MSLTLKSPKPTHCLLVFDLYSGFGRRGRLFPAEGGAAFQLQLVLSLIINSCEWVAYQMCFPPGQFLGGLLPGIWNVPDRETCTFFYGSTDGLQLVGLGSLDRFNFHQAGIKRCAAADVGQCL